LPPTAADRMNERAQGHHRFPSWVTSVRARTTVLAALVVGVTLAGGAFGLLATLEHSLVSTRDALSRARADDLAADAARGTLPRRLSDIGEDFVGQVVAADGTVLSASSGLRGKGPISSLGGATSTPSERTLHGVPDDSELENYRVWVLRGHSPTGPVTIFVGASLESVKETVSTLRRALLVGVPVMLALFVLGTRIIVGRALRPVEDIRAEVAAISATAMDRRLAVPATADEIERLAATMNDMLDRLGTARTRQQEFVADASHELQSPLAAFRVQLEVALAHPDGVAWQTLAAELLDDSDGMERLVRDLLFLAQEDSSHQVPRTESLDLDEVVLDEVARVRDRVAVAFDTSRVSAAPVRGSRDDLARLVRNLIENAASHARSHVSVQLSTTATFARLTVCDDGPGIPVDQRERVFDRFARVGGARTRDPVGSRGGTGLGLSIARAIAERHQGSIRVEAPSGGEVGACLVVELPIASTHVPQVPTPPKPGRP